MLPKDWLKQFLETKQLPRPDERPLYRYRLSDDEFKAIKHILNTTAKLGIEHLNAVNGWNAVFALYAAEWWRREYDGSSWKWENLFASFDADVQDLSTSQRNLIVETGLRYWRRELRVINGRTRYLGTIATEGGLPLNQLKNSKNDWLSRVFKQVIPKFTRLQHTGTDAAQLVAECEFIPKNYHYPQIHAILGDMVAEVVNLKRTHKLQDRSNPIAYLDQAAPRWRDNFPLPIDDNIGGKLLSDMIFTAAKADETPTLLPIRSTRRLGDDGSVCLQLELAGFITLETLGLTDSTPGRIDIELVDTNGQIISLGVALKTEHQQKPSLKMPKPPAAIDGDAALLGYTIRFKHLSETLKEIPLIGGEALTDDVPWVFVQREEQWEMAGLASFNTRAPKIRVLYPANWHCEPCDHQALATASPNKKLLEASGVIRLTDNEGGTFVIKTAQEKASAYYFLEGKPLPFASAPKEAYLGLPTLCYADSETGVHKTLTNKLAARPVNGQGAWQPLTANMQGVYELRYSDSNAILFRKKCVLLPEAFTVRFLPSSAPGSLDGTIFLEHIGNAKPSCEPSIKHAITPENSGYKLDLFAGENPPSQAGVTLHWPGMTDMLTLSLPFPARGGQIINAEGNRQSKDLPLFQDTLHGIRLRLFNEQPERRRHLQIDLSLVDTQLADTRDIYFRNKTTREGALIELAVIDYLDWIKTLLTVSGHLDSHVQLVVYENGSELVRVNICRYALELDRNLPEGTVTLTNSHCLSLDTLNGIKLKAMRLSQPEQAHIDLPAHTSGHTLTGAWRFQPEKRAAEPWLIYPAKDASLALRPLLWAVDYEAGQGYHHNPDTQTLHCAVMIGHIETRHGAIKIILSAMSQDFSHSGWDYLRQLWRHCPHLPLSSFDAWTLAVKDSQVLVALALQMDTDFIDKLNAEMPVFWELMPLSDWLAVYSAYRSYLQNQGMEETDIHEFTARRIDKITAACPSLDVVAKLLKYVLLGECHQDMKIKSLPHEMLAEMIKQQRQDLDRKQADSDWPPLMQAELRSAWQQLNPTQQLGIKLDDMPDHHHPVVILPLLLAAHCANGGYSTTWLGNPTAIFKLKRLKNFDEEWFNTIFQWALAYLSQQSR